MGARFDFIKHSAGAYRAMAGLEQYLHECGLDQKIIHLIKLRVSQINGCAYCLDMHWKDLRALGESELRLYELGAWEETELYTEKERAALKWAEVITGIAETHAPDEAYAEVRRQFSEKEVADLTVAIATINAWNRLAIAARVEPGKYQPAQRELKQPA
jgi:AhpD family alkylhydroperoxidase